MSFSDDFDRAFDELDPADAKGWRTNYVTLLALRQALPQYDRKTFDAELNQLRRMQRYSLDESDGRHKRMTRAEAEAGIKDWKDGPVLVYAARRPVENPSANPRRGRRMAAAESTITAFYVDGLNDAPGFDLNFDDLARQVMNGADVFAVAHAAVDVQLKEAEVEEHLEEEWLENNADLLAEVKRDEGIDAPALYDAWRRGLRDGETRGAVAEIQAAMKRIVEDET